MKEIIDVIHKTIYQFFDEYDEETPISDKDKLLLEVNKAICNNLKTLHQEPRWIPVSERLPDIDGEEYLVYRKTDTFVKRPFRIDIARWYSDDTENNGFNKYSEVIAWMPLPKAYKEEENETN